MSKLISYSVIPKGKPAILLANKCPLYIIPSRAKRIPSHKLRFAGDGDYSQTDPGKLTDIRHYQYLDKSHLHKWDARSSKRKFMLKLEEMEKRKFFAPKGFGQKHSVLSNDLDSENSSSSKQTTDKVENEQKLSDPIVIPTYIERSPSAILRVLATCVGRDKTAPDHKYHDDPFLIPYNSIQKRDYIAAKDGGQRAARYVLDKHPELFEKNLIYDEPKIRYEL